MFPKILNQVSMLAVIGVFISIQIVISAEPTPQKNSADSYFGKLQKEFKEIGPARFVNGKDENEILQNLQFGGGMEKFFQDSKHEKSLLSGVEDIEGQPFSKAFKLIVDTKPKVYWNAQFQIQNQETLHKGDSILVVFWAKGKKAPQIVDDGVGATLQTYVRAVSGLGKFHKNRVSNFYDCKMLSEKWERYYIKTGPLPIDFPPGKLALVGMVGHKPQTVEVGGIAWMVFPQDSNLEKMPKPGWDYEGRKADAPWRKEAEKRIGKYRKGNMQIEVIGEDGKPLANTDVRVRMKKHAFRFGVAVNVSAFHGAWKGVTADDIAKYREISTRYYNAIVLDNHLKWVYFESGRKNQWQDIKDCLKFYHDQGKFIRGHVLVWPTVFRVPEPLAGKLKKDKSLLGQTVKEHITEEVTEFKTWVNDWDVTNETNVNRDFMDNLGPEAMIEWYKTAHEADPKAALTFNEPHFGSEGMELGSFPEKLLNDKCRGWVDYLIQNGVPLNYIGSQCHGGSVGKDFGGKTGPEGLWQYFDYLQEHYGKQLQYTELDVNIGNASDTDQLAYQADKLRDSIIIAFAHPAFVGITQWGFWAGSHYAPNAALWTKDWQLRPCGKAYTDLVYNKWWTNADLKTDAKGKCEINAFYGDYEVSVGGKNITVSFTKESKQISIKIK